MDQEQNNSTEAVQGGNLLNEPVSKNMMIVSVIAVIVVVLTLMYVWGTNIDNRAQDMANLPPLPAEDVQVEALKQVSTSNEVDAIEQDLNTTDLENIDADLDQMEAELNAQ